MKLNLEQNAAQVKSLALSVGFDSCGIAKALCLDEDARRLENWLHKGRHGEMKYLENHFDLRIDPTKLVPGAKSVITLLFDYFPEKRQEAGNPKIAKYAYGKDYHDVIQEKLREFLTCLREEIGEINGRSFVDSAPILERQWAQRAGLGWIGKNSLLLNRSMGSFFFLAELVIDLEASPDLPIAKDYCGTCTACLDACPTEAIVAPGVVDGSRCISYLTIELKDAIPNTFAGKMDNWVFGCDVCQDVCPWNRFSKPNQEAAFSPSSDLETLAAQDWKELTEETFKRVFAGSAVTRTKFKGIKRNLEFIAKDKSSD